MFITVIALLAQFYVALYPIGGPNLDTSTWFQLYLAGPLLVFLYLVWKVYSFFKRPADRPLWISTKDIDIYTGMRQIDRVMTGDVSIKQKKGVMGHFKNAFSAVF